MPFHSLFPAVHIEYAVTVIYASARCLLCRYTLAAQDLLMRSRGVLKERGWRLPNDRLGSGDDITVFVIPLAGHESETWRGCSHHYDRADSLGPFPWSSLFQLPKPRTSGAVGEENIFVIAKTRVWPAPSSTYHMRPSPFTSS